MKRSSAIVVWLWITAFACGAIVMAVEFLGARMLGVEYGSSQIVWAAMISVTLFSLTAGYFVGGSLSDRFPRPALLYAAILAAGALLIVCPHAGFVLKACRRGLGIRGGALASSLVLFVLPLGLLGMTSPFVIKLLTERGRSVGRTAGGVYAVSTVGSVAGTLLTAFLLIPGLGTPASFRVCSVAAAAVGAAGLATVLGLWGAVAFVLPPVLAFVPIPRPSVGLAYTAPDGQPVTVRSVCDSQYGRIVILDKGDAQTGYRLLVVNGIVQTGVPRNFARLPRGAHLLTPYFQELLPYTVEKPESANALLIGLAGGMTASLLQKYGIATHAVDLDPEMIRIARQMFGFRGPAVAADGRRFLEACDKHYDFCVIDTYSGDGFPYFMASVEGVAAARKVLKPGGLLAVNFIGTPAGRPFACVYKTLQAVFPHVLALRGEESKDVQTITLFARDQAITFNKGWMDFQTDTTGPDRVSDLIDRFTITPRPADGFVLTDAYNPIDLIRQDEAVRWRERAITQNIGEQALF